MHSRGHRRRALETTRANPLPVLDPEVLAAAVSAGVTAAMESVLEGVQLHVAVCPGRGRVTTPPPGPQHMDNVGYISFYISGKSPPFRRGLRGWN